MAREPLQYDAPATTTKRASRRPCCVVGCAARPHRLIEVSSYRYVGACEAHWRAANRDLSKHFGGAYTTRRNDEAGQNR